MKSEDILEARNLEESILKKGGEDEPLDVQ